MQSAESERSSLEYQILPKLRPFQREAFDFATKGTLYARQLANHPTEQRNNNAVLSFDRSLLGKGRILLADEMGLGKTVTSLAIMSHYEKEWNPFLLIICPASLRHVWPAEIERFFPSISPQSVHVCQGFSDIQWKNTKILVVTFSLLQERSAVAHKLQQLDVACVIVDESHHMKQKDSQRTKALLPILSRANRVALLSGTPALAKPVELWTQLHVLAPKAFGTFSEFVNLYCNPIKKHVGRNRMIWDYSGAANTQELHAKLQNVMVRRLKSSVLSELPPKQRSIVPVSIDGSGNKEKCLEAMRALDSGDTFESASSHADFGSKRTEIMKAYQMTGIGKAHSVANYLLDWLEGSGQEKVLVFCHHKAVMDVIDKAILNKYPNAHIRIDGGTQNAIRGQLVNRFQTCNRVRVGLLSMTAAGVGLTLTAAATVIFAELHWTPGILAQAEDRVHRIGQMHSSVQIIYMICKDKNCSLDMNLWAMLGRKIGTIDSVVDGKADTPYLYAAQQKDEFRSSGVSGQNELVEFFAEASADETARAMRVPFKGSIMSFFKKVNCKESVYQQASGEGVEVVQSQAGGIGNQTGKPRGRKCEEEIIQPQATSDFALTSLPNKKRLRSIAENDLSVAALPWTCGHCTYENTKDDDRVCLVCGNARGTTAMLLPSITKSRPTVTGRTGLTRSNLVVQKSKPATVGQLNSINVAVAAGKSSNSSRKPLLADDDDSDSDLEDVFYQPVRLEKRVEACADTKSSSTSATNQTQTLVSQEQSSFTFTSSSFQALWVCRSCTFENAGSALQCEMCTTPLHEPSTASVSKGAPVVPCVATSSQIVVRTTLRDASAHRKNAKRVSLDNDIIELEDSPAKPAFKDIIAIDSSSDDELLAHTRKQAAHPTYSFSVSKNTGRVTIHDFLTSESLLVNFDLKEVLTGDSADRLLDGRIKHASLGTNVLSIVFHDPGIESLRQKVAQVTGKSAPHLCDELKSFALAYLRLRETEKKALQNQSQPVQGAGLSQFAVGLSAKSFMNTNRYIGGAKERAMERSKEGCATDSDLAVLDRVACAWCGAQLQQAVRRADGVYCSQNCCEEGRLRRGGQFASSNLRAAVFALETGKCTLCGIDAHSLFEEIRSVDPPVRLNKLMSAKWKLPKSRNALESLLRDPKEGNFWQVDHIIAVSEGGGGCGLENLRTLCVPCHDKETEDLRRRLRLRSPSTKEGDGCTEKSKQSNLNQYFTGKTKPGAC